MPPPPDPARIAVAQLQGAARHWARYGRTSEDEALDELDGILAPFGDMMRSALLAEAAGIILGGCREPELKPEAEKAAGLLLKAGADETAVPGWVEEGKRRRERAELPPFGAKLIQQRQGEG